MKKYLIPIIGAASLVACAPEHSHKKTVYTFADGSKAYQSDDGFWYWYIINSQMQKQFQTSSAIGTWARTSYAPSTSQIKTAASEEEDAEEINNPEDETLSEESSTESESSVESSTESPSESSVDSGSSDSGGSFE